MDASPVDLLVPVRGPGSAKGLSLSPGQGLNWPEGPAQPRHPAGAPASGVCSAGVGPRDGSDWGWRLRKGGRGQSPGMVQKWGQEGPRWRRRGRFRCQPCRPSAWFSCSHCVPHTCAFSCPGSFSDAYYVLGSLLGPGWGGSACLCGAHVLITERQ